MANDYIITFDENGQPYIEHFSIKGAYGAAKNKISSGYNKATAKLQGVKNYGVGRGVRKNHKYIAKIGNRYIYDAKELAAAKANQFKSATKNVARNARNTINRNGTLIKSSANKAKNKATETAKNAKNKARDIIGYDERERLNKAEKNAEAAGKVYGAVSKAGTKTISKSIWEKNPKKSDELFNQGIKMRDSAWRAMDGYDERLRSARDAYDKTLLGKVDKAKEKVKDLKTDIELAVWDAGETAKKVGKNVGKKVGDAAFDVEWSLNKAKKNAKEMANTASEKTKDKADRMKEDLRKNVDEIKNKVSNVVGSERNKNKSDEKDSKDTLKQNLEAIKSSRLDEQKKRMEAMDVTRKEAEERAKKEAEETKYHDEYAKKREDYYASHKVINKEIDKLENNMHSANDEEMKNYYRQQCEGAILKGAVQAFKDNIYSHYRSGRIKDYHVGHWSYLELEKYKSRYEAVTGKKISEEEFERLVKKKIPMSEIDNMLNRD